MVVVAVVVVFASAVGLLVGLLANLPMACALTLLAAVLLVALAVWANAMLLVATAVQADALVATPVALLMVAMAVRANAFMVALAVKANALVATVAVLLVALAVWTNALVAALAGSLCVLTDHPPHGASPVRDGAPYTSGGIGVAARLKCASPCQSLRASLFPFVVHLFEDLEQALCSQRPVHDFDSRSRPFAN